MMNKKEIVLKKLNITERGAMYILNDPALCERIVNEDVIELKAASIKYDIPLLTIKKYVNENIITSIRNGVELKGRKQYIFENELIEFFNLYLKIKNGYLKYISNNKKIILEFTKKILTDKEYLVYEMVNNGINHSDIAEKLKMSKAGIYSIYKKSTGKINRYINKLESYDEVFEKIKEKKHELISLNKSIKQVKNYIKKEQLTEAVKLADVYSIRLNDLQILNNRSKNFFKHIKLKSVGDFVEYIDKHGIEFLLKYREVGAGTYKNILVAFSKLSEKHNLNIKL